MLFQVDRISGRGDLRLAPAGLCAVFNPTMYKNITYGLKNRTGILPNQEVRNSLTFK